MYGPLHFFYIYLRETDNKDLDIFCFYIYEGTTPQKYTCNFLDLKYQMLLW